MQGLTSADSGSGWCLLWNGFHEMGWLKIENE